MYIEQTLIHDTVPEGEGNNQVEPQLEITSEGIAMVFIFKAAEEKEQWKQQLYNSKLRLQEEELKKANSRPRRRNTNRLQQDASVVKENRVSIRPVEPNSLLKTVGGGGLKRTAANIEAFRSKNLNSNSNAHLAMLQKEENAAFALGEPETEGAALEKLKKAVEVEEEKKEKVAKEIAEVEESLAALQQQLAAQQAKNAELEKAINEAKAKGVRSERRK